jgi:hypothetical protein
VGRSQGTSPAASSKHPAGQVRKFDIERSDPLIESAPFAPHVLDQYPDPAADRDLVCEKSVELDFELAPSFCDHNSSFEKDRAKLVDPASCAL